MKKKNIKLKIVKFIKSCHYFLINVLIFNYVRGRFNEQFIGELNLNAFV